MGPSLAVRVATLVSVAGLVALATMLTAPSVSAQANMTLSKRASTAQVAPNTPFTYTLNYSCSSLETTCNGVTITDVLPPQLSRAAADVTLIGDAHTVSTSYNATNGTATFVLTNPLAAGTTGAVTISVKFPANITPVGATATNSATMTASNADTVTSNAVTVAAVVTPAVAATKALSTSPFVVGVPATYTVTWKNTGNVNLTAPTLTDTLPAGVTCAMVSSISHNSGATAATCNDTTPATITWAMTSPGTPTTTYTQTFVVTYPASFAAAPITNTVVASGIPLGVTEPISSQASVTNTPVVPAPAVVVAKIEAPSVSAPLGTPITYTVSIRNSGNVPLTSVTMTDPLPGGATFLSCTTPNAGACVNNAGTLTWTFTSNLAVGGTFTGTSVVRYDSPPNMANDTVTNTVTGRGTPVTGGDQVTGMASVDLLLTAGGGGAVTKTLTTPVNQFAVDNPVTYSISVRNTTAATWDSVVITDPLPTSTVGMLPPINVTCTPTADCVYTPGNNTVTWTFTTPIPPATTVTGTITLTYPFTGPVGFQPGEVVTNCASAVSQPGSVPIPQSCDTHTLLPAVPGANITKSDTKSTVVVGSFDTYTLTHQNTGTESLTSYTVTDLIPPNLQPYQTPATNVSFTDTRPGNLGTTDVLEYRDPSTGTFVPVTKTCTNQAGTTPNTCTGKVTSTTTDQIRVVYSGIVPLGFTATVTLVLQVPPSAVARSGVEILNGNAITNCATVTATQLTTTPQSCTNQAVSEPVPTETLTKSRTSPSPVPPPSPVNWSIVYGTPATSPVPNVNPVLTDCLPPGLDLVDPANPADPANGGPPATFTPAPTITRAVGAPCAANQIAVIWSWAGSVPALSIPAGTTGTFTLNTVLQPGTPPGTLTNSVTAVEDNNPTPTPPATATVVVASGASLDSIKLIKGSLDTAYGKYPDIGHTTFGGSADYRMQITNTGNIAINKITAIDILPFVGDTAVLNAADPRGSQWRPILTGAVTAPAGVNVLYSGSSNPCRPELNYSPAGCVSGSFSTAPPGGDFGAVRSLEFQYPGTLAAGASIQIDWPMVAPADVIPGQVAWNSFGYTGFRVDTGDQLAPAEPNKVGIQIEPYPLLLQKDVNGVHAPVAPGPNIPTGTPVTYTYTITNPGDLVVTNVTLTDNPPQSIDCGATPVTIQPHDFITCTAQAGDALAGEHSDTATVTGQPVVGGTPGTPTEPVSDTANYFGTTARITLEKDLNKEHVPQPPGIFVPAGSTVTFAYVVTNPGNVTLEDITLTDDVLGDLTLDCPHTSLGPGASMICTAFSPAAPDEHTNTAEITGQPVDASGAPLGPEVFAEDVGNYFGEAPDISVVKKVNGVHAPVAPGPEITVGTPVTYTYVVTNTGNATLDSISLEDDVLGDLTLDCPETSLAPQDSMTCTASGGSATLGPHPNTATVTGQGVDNQGHPIGEPVKGTDEGNYVGVKASPTVATTPSAGGPVGTAISDRARVEGGVDPTGTVSFALYGPGDAHCVTDLVATVAAFKNLSLSGSQVTSPTFTATAAGTYQWIASYSGGPNSNPASGNCGDSSEQVHIAAGPTSPPTAPRSVPGLPNTGFGGGNGGPAVLTGLFIAGLGGGALALLRRRRRGTGGEGDRAV